jgi:hypothetical protein
MALPLVPILLASGLGVAYVRAKKRKGLTPARKKLYESALKSMKEPASLRKLADSFEKEGLRAEAVELRKRADVLALPPEKKRAYKAAYKEGLAASDPNKVNALARAFNAKGFYGSAKNLRDYALGLVRPKTDAPPSHFVPNEPLQAE